jgi:hypothetical protein
MGSETIFSGFEKLEKVRKRDGSIFRGNEKLDIKENRPFWGALLT